MSRRSRMVIDLDALVPAETLMRLGGMDYVIEVPTLARFLEIQRINVEHELVDLKEGMSLTENQLAGIKASICIMVPGLPQQVLEGISTRQLNVLQKVLGELIRPSSESVVEAMERVTSEEEQEEEEGEV